MHDFANVLRNNNMKVTPQRIAIYQVLSSTVEHPSAEMIYNKLAPSYPTMSLATVYKSLDAFKKAGLIQEINVGEYSFRYDANAISHPHMICTQCRRVDDLDTNILSDLINKINDYTQYQVERQQIYFYGKCPMCK